MLKFFSSCKYWFCSSNLGLKKNKKGAIFITPNYAHLQNIYREHALQQISVSCYKQGSIKIHSNRIYKRKINMASGISKAENDSIKFLQLENALTKYLKPMVSFSLSHCATG